MVPALVTEPSPGAHSRLNSTDKRTPRGSGEATWFFVGGRVLRPPPRQAWDKQEPRGEWKLSTSRLSGALPGNGSLAYKQTSIMGTGGDSHAPYHQPEH